MSAAPLELALAVHLHQPVGNFDDVFEAHLRRVYAPFLDAVLAREGLPLTLHISGPLLEWLEANAPSFVDRIGRHVEAGRIELLASGWSEPILAAWDDDDRVGQIEAMRRQIRRRFGVEPRGLWLTERVWEPDLPVALVRGGIEYTLLDDRHFLAAGVPRHALDRPLVTEAGGARLRLLPIDERLRYLIPFRPVEEIAGFLAERRSEGTALLVLGDDGEKFGGWPDTHAWVYEGGWLGRFLDRLERLRDEGALALLTTGEAARRPSGGLVYPTAGSYREMEEWTLPRAAALELEARWAREEGRPSPFTRGGHWKGFLSRYPEANRMHKATAAVRRLCRERGDPEPARRAVWRAQCNDAYWHGVFGGIYLPHLRGAVWRALAAAERLLRRDDALSCRVEDRDLDGHDEVCVHSPAFSAVLGPARGGAIEQLLRLETGENDADVLARHLEAYHLRPGDPGADRVSPDEPGSADTGTSGGTASIHERPRRAVPPGVDATPRAIFQERVLAADADPAALLGGAAEVRHDAAARRWRVEAIEADEATVVVRLAAAGDGPALAKRYEIDVAGRVRVRLSWDAIELADVLVTTELSLAHPRAVRSDPAATLHRGDIVTLGRSERGFERVRQGESVVISWPGGAGGGEVELVPPGGR